MSTPTIDDATDARFATIAHIGALRIYCGRLQALQTSLEPADGSVPPKWMLDNGIKLLALKEKVLEIIPQLKESLVMELMVELVLVERDIGVEWTKAVVSVSKMLVMLTK